MMQRSLIAALVTATACGGGRLPYVAEPDAGTTAAKGSFVAWPVAAGTVTAYRLDSSGQRTATVGTAQTDSTGAFALRLTGSTTGPMLVVVSSGSFIEPATGTAVHIEGAELTALLPSATRVAGDLLAGVLVSPVSHLTAQLAFFQATHGNGSLDDAIAQAATLIEGHFGGVNWRTLGAPPDLSDPTAAAVVQVNDTTKAALILAGLSMEARNLAIAKGLTPGGPLNSLSLVSALAQDLAADGYFDGTGAGGTRLAIPVSAANGYALDGQTVRATLAQGISTFLTSSRNASKVAQADAQSLLAAIAQDGNRQLFREQGGSVDITPPTVKFVQPVADASVLGQIMVEATATDDVAMQAFLFTAPPSLASTQATSENGGKTMRLRTLLDVSALGDGALTVSVAATDASSNTATQNLSLRVANHGPSIFVNTPSSNATVRGTVTLTATASGQNGATVTRLALVNPPRGIGIDSLPAADALQVAWDTTQELEGLLALRFHAEDDRGAATDFTVPVVVDNVPFGVVTARLSAGGNGISGASVTVTAIDDTTGLPLTAIGDNGQLGGCRATDSAGALACTLSVENYAGPIQVAAGGRSLSYTDPSDGLAVISIPESFQFISYVGHYRTGDTITVPLTLWTTLADQAALAYVQGRNRAALSPHSLTDSLLVIDPLFDSHVATGWDLRSATPVSLTSTQQTLRDVVYAALPDVALNQLARDRSIAASLTPGGSLTAITLTQLLSQDLAADGQFDGLGQGAQQLQTAGNPAQKPDSNFLRYEMARALDEWFQTPRNRTGLLSSDIQNAGVFDRIAGDTSLVFGTTPLPIPYDNQPPSVSFSATFHAVDGQDHAPVGGSRIVSGRVDLVVSASDSSGVAAISVAQGAVTLSAGAGSSLPTRWVGSFDTTKVADGPLTFAATATDKLGNAGTTYFQVTVDNTPPVITVAQPVAGKFYSATIPADASASDASGVAGLVESSLTIADQDLTVTHFLGTWSIPSNRADGPATVTYKACDVVFNCTSTPVAVSVDRTPPAMSFTAQLPQYTNSGKGTMNHPVLVSVSADDGSGAGVADVVVANTTTGSLKNATLSGGTWSATLQMQQGQNAIVVYASDNAIPSNTGSGKATPYALAASVLLDTSDPSITVQTAASYKDEREMDFLRSADGTPTMPVSYTFPVGATPVAIDLNNVVPVYKSVTRLSSNGTAVTAAELVAGNLRLNAPYLAFSIPAGGSEAPIVTASFTASVSCPGGGCPAFTDVTGSLLAATNQTYLLPLTSDAIPALAQLTTSQAAQVSISVSSTDAAGNVGSTPPSSYRFKFQLVAPPLSLVEDANFAIADPRAAGKFRIGDATYSALFDRASAAFGSEGPRFVRYVVYNPAPVPLAISTGVGDSSVSRYTAFEGWLDYTPGDFVPGSFCFDFPGGACGYSGWPCGFGTSPIYLPDGRLDCSAGPKGVHPEESVGGSQLALGHYQVTASGETVAPAASNGGVIVPAASGTTPGRLAIYVGRPASIVSRGSQTTPALEWNSARGRYEDLVAMLAANESAMNSCDCDPETGCRGQYLCYGGTTSWYVYLGAAHSQVNGALTIASSSVAAGSTTAIGTSRLIANSMSFSRSVSH